MKELIKMLRNKWHNDLLENQKVFYGQAAISGFTDKIKTDGSSFNPHDYDISHVVNGKSWFADYAGYDEFNSDKIVQEYIKKLLVITSYFTFHDIKAYCEICGNVTTMKPFLDYITESYACCGMNSRQRAMYEYIVTHYPCKCKVYISEAVTSAYNAYEKYFGPGNIMGSEYLGKNMVCGEYYEYNGHKIMHQDSTKISFKEETFDLIISQHVLEHIFDVRTALSELLRILKSSGYCIISIPFFWGSRNSLMLAREKEWQVEQIINPPEIHGNPVGGGGGGNIIMGKRVGNYRKY
jgi:hypothetical protein